MLAKHCWQVAVCLGIAYGWLSGSAGLAQTTYYVDDANGDDASHTGSGGWSDAFKTISNAVAAATGLDTILVTAGTYNVTEQIDLTNAVSLIGVAGPADTLIVGNYTKRGFMLSNESAIVSGFTITNFKAHVFSGFSYAYGGGVLIMGGGIVSNCIFAGNYGQRGGGIQAGGHGTYQWPGAYTIADCVFSNNIASFWGGGMRALGSGSVYNCTFTGNRIELTNQGAGAGISVNFIDRGRIVSGCVFRANAGFTGSAVYSSRGTITHSDLIGNSSTGSTLGLADSSAINCRIEGNLGGRGAAIYFGTDSSLRNCLIAGNTNNSSSLGVIEFNAGTMESCTIANNVATFAGGTGGIWFYTYSGHPVRTVINTIIYGNLNSEGETSNWSGGNFDNSTITYTCTTPESTHAAWGDGIITNNPQLLADYRLPKSSPCVNQGAYQSWMDDATDLAGNPRLDPAWHLTDIGCYEFILNSGTIFAIR